MPAEQCVGRDDRIELEELLAADRLRMPSKEPAFSVGEDNPPTTETRLEHPVLGLEVFDEPFLLPGEPRSDHDDQKLHQRRALEPCCQPTSGRRIMLARPRLSIWTVRAQCIWFLYLADQEDPRPNGLTQQ